MSVNLQTWRWVGAIAISLILLLTLLGCSSTPDQGWITAGRVKVTSGSLLISDPLCLPEASPDLTVQVHDIAPSTYEVEVWQADLGEYGQRITRARIVFLPAGFYSRKPLGSVGVDSACLIAIDPAHIATEWVTVGPRRDGYTIGTDRAQIAALLRANGFRIGAADEWYIELSNPVSEEDERRGDDSIAASGLLGVLIIGTGNSYDRVAALLGDSADWGELPFANGSSGLAVAFTSGIGDEEYSTAGGLCRMGASSRH